MVRPCSLAPLAWPSFLRWRRSLSSSRRKSPRIPFDTGDKKDGDKKLIDKEGREYRICPQCGYNMYKQGRMWVCDNCGYSYVE